MLRKRKKLSAAHRLKIGLAGLGRKHTAESKKKISVSHLGERNPSWKGERAGYFSKHEWVRKHFGSANKCEKCSKVGNNRQIHWANISRKYKRERSDWLRLCVRCHQKFDGRVRDKKGRYANKK